MRPTLLALLAVTLPAIAQTPEPVDPYIWLEEFSSPRAMAWVEQHNETTTNRLEADPRYARNYSQALEIAGARDRIPEPRFVHGEIYNFWQDREHLRGLWRKTSLADYSSPEPHWTIVLDVDALNKSEGKSWVFKGAELLRPDETRCMLSLSDGGEDAVVSREFDLTSDRFVDGGFSLPRGKHRIAWENKDTLLVATDWQPGELTSSGYPFIVKRLKRGQPLSAAVEVFRGTKDDGGYGVSPDVLHDGQGHSLSLVIRPLDTFRFEHYVLTEHGTERMAIPAKAQVSDLVDGRVLLRLEEPWSVDGKTFEAGSVVQTELPATKKSPGALKPALVWAPGPREALSGLGSTRDKLLLQVLDNVQGRAFIYSPSGHGWKREALSLPENVSVSVAAADQRSNHAFINVSGFLSPTELWLVDGDTAALRKVKALPPKFDASKDTVEQFEAASSDGTKIPYFVVHPKDMALDGSTPTLMTAYGGFQVPRTPAYLGVTGKLWSEQGGFRPCQHPWRW